MRLKERYEIKQKLAAEIKRQVDLIRGADHTPEQMEAWNKVNADYDENERLIAVEKTFNAHQKTNPDNDRPEIFLASRKTAHGSQEVRANAIVGWLASAICHTDPSDE